MNGFARVTSLVTARSPHRLSTATVLRWSLSKSVLVSAPVATISVPSAVVVALDTAGRAVLFAGTTVVIALLGLLVLNTETFRAMEATGQKGKETP